MKYNSIKVSIAALLSLLLIVAFAACRQHQQRSATSRGDNIHIVRFDKMLFDTPPAQLRDTLIRHQNDYACNLLNVHPDDPQLMAQMIDYAQDPYVRQLYDSVQVHFADLSWLEADLTRALQRLSRQGVTLNYSRYIAFVSATLDYDYRVVADGQTLLIALDQYVVKGLQQYGYMGLPQYIVNLCDPRYLTVDCVAAMGRAAVEIAAEGADMTMLDFMIADGKTLYFTDCALPKTADTLKLRYTQQQLAWMEANEANVWAYLIQNDLLFEKDYTRFNNLIDEAPKTNAFRDSAPRTAQYIGLQIVKQYVKKSGCTLTELLAETDSRKILNTSNYHPK